MEAVAIFSCFAGGVAGGHCSNLLSSAALQLLSGFSLQGTHVEILTSVLG